MKLKELIEKSKEDLVLGDELDHVSQDMGRRIAQWLEFLIQESLNYKQIEFTLKSLEKEKLEFYTTNYDILVDKKDALSIYLPADVDIQAIKKNLVVAQHKVDLCEKVVRGLSNTSFTIKNIIEYRKFMSGVV
jgi:hypothetical protein